MPIDEAGTRHDEGLRPLASRRLERPIEIAGLPHLEGLQLDSQRPRRPLRLAELGIGVIRIHSIATRDTRGGASLSSSIDFPASRS